MRLPFIVAGTLLVACCCSAVVGCKTQAVPTARLDLTETQERQMELLRTGQPPLPIPITQQMDDLLVQEGVLCPQSAETNYQMRLIRPGLSPRRPSRNKE